MEKFVFGLGAHKTKNGKISISSLKKLCIIRKLSIAEVTGNKEQRIQNIIKLLYNYEQLPKDEKQNLTKALTQYNQKHGTNYVHIEDALLETKGIAVALPNQLPPYTIEPYIMYVIMYISARNSSNVVFLNEIVNTLNKSYSPLNKVMPKTPFIRNIVNLFIKNGYKLQGINCAACITKICTDLCLCDVVGELAYGLVAKYQLLKDLDISSRVVLHDEFIIMGCILLILILLYKFDNPPSAIILDNKLISLLQENQQQTIAAEKDELHKKYSTFNIPSKLEVLTTFDKIRTKFIQQKHNYSFKGKDTSKFINQDALELMSSNVKDANIVENNTIMAPHTQTNYEESKTNTSISPFDQYYSLNPKYIQFDQYANTGNELSIVLNTLTEYIGECESILLAFKKVEGIVLK